MTAGRRFANPRPAETTWTWACACCPAHGRAATHASAIARLEQHHATRHRRPPRRETP